MTRRAWTEDERLTVAAMLQDGHSLTTIARKVNRTIRAIYTYMERRADANIKALRAADGATVRSARQVALLFGVTDMMVLGWIERGWIKARRNGTYVKTGKRGPRRASKQARARFLITDDALVTFIERRDLWPAWSPLLMTDRDWQAYAVDVRANAGGHWIATKELAARYGYDADTVNGWYRLGHTAGIESVRVGNGRYFWSADLAGFVPPCERRAA